MEKRKKGLTRFEQNVTRIDKPPVYRFTQLTHSPDYKIDPKPTTMVIYTELGKPVQFLFCLIDRFFRKKKHNIVQAEELRKSESCLVMRQIGVLNLLHSKEGRLQSGILRQEI